MSYDNAEPKVLKTLNSSGQVLDDSGNVINDTSDYWVQLYNQTEPKVDKILKSDGTIVDAAGNLIQDTTEFNVKKYNQAEPIPAKYLHADGTIDENPGGESESIALHCWVTNAGAYLYTDFEESPISLEELKKHKRLDISSDKITSVDNFTGDTFNHISDYQFQLNNVTFIRQAGSDVTVW